MMDSMVFVLLLLRILSTRTGVGPQQATQDVRVAVEIVVVIDGMHAYVQFAMAES